MRAVAGEWEVLVVSPMGDLKYRLSWDSPSLTDFINLDYPYNEIPSQTLHFYAQEARHEAGFLIEANEFIRPSPASL
jgi:hypothetical protein